MTVDGSFVVCARLLDSRGDLWWPSLTDFLVKTRLDRPVCERSPSCTQYTTSRFLTGDADADSDTLWVTPAVPFPGPRLRIECLSSNAALHPLVTGRDLARSDEIRQPTVLGAVSRASALIGSIPSLAASIERLALSIHIVRQDDPAYDVSFSEPYIPFSIFVSIPGDSWKAAARVAEAIIHEAMHLQLSLVEQLVPLAQESAEQQYSPWKREARPVSGLIHALYVFAVIDGWLALLSPSWSIADYVRSRREQIVREVAEIDFSACEAGATQEGQALINTIARRFNHR
ncbi:HEXXH motif-containing putative peptide modification protein [Paraburkholderia sediminicola]|uniref:aKG-HExxH-type peptide beta-hydroxylase n=1 Tax=Paraburkholderia sediminicola TaxID=458836 RepID=UPI0038B9CE75